ncbi:MAG TPA: homoserine/homoserine lactone efflux protein [Azoarcus taiwanensis]|nr:homoserine/homoserine lactone efflux protein [Azoarcus taiwanensis]
MTWNMWLAFLAASVVISVTPGPGAVLSIATGMRHGYSNALRAISGLQTALLIHLSIVALGLGAVLAASDMAFLALKIAGALYLVWLGIQKWRAPVEEIDENALPSRKGRGFYLQGVLVNLTNPKGLVFIVAFVPQFVMPSQPQLPQFLIIGLTMVGVDLIVMSGYALLAGRCSAWFHSPNMIGMQNRVFGGLFVSAGALLAASSR